MVGCVYREQTEGTEMNKEQRDWCAEQPWFAYSVENSVVFTECGKRFDNFDDVSKWANDVPQYEKVVHEKQQGLFCRNCGTHLMVKNICTIFCPNKDCE